MERRDMMNPRHRQPRTRLVRTLSLELDEDLRECLSGFVQEAAGGGISVVTLIPAYVPSSPKKSFGTGSTASGGSNVKWSRAFLSWSEKPLFPFILCFGFQGGLPLHIMRVVWPATFGLFSSELVNCTVHLRR